MRVRFSPHVVQHAPSWNQLDELVHHFLEGRHEWHIEDPAHLASSNWITSDAGGRAGKRNLEALQKAATSSMWGATGAAISVIVDIASQAAHVMSAAEAVRALAQPAYVVVENSESDGAFIQTMAFAFGRRRLIEAHTQGWWELEHAGGFGECEKRVQEIKAKRAGPLRVLVLTDSDVRFSGDTSATAKKIEGFCKANGVPYFILCRRKIENYIPLEALDGKPPLKIGAFATLTPEQQQYFDLKNGFSAYAAADPLKVAALYASVPKHARTALEGGFGKYAWRAFIDNARVFTAQSVRKWCASDPTEMDRLLDLVESLL